MAYKIYVNPNTANLYRIAFPSDHVKSDYYKTPCIGAIESELIEVLQSLRNHSELKNGYPGSVISSGIHRVETALLLLDKHKQEVLRGKPAKQLIGKPPAKALSSLHVYHQEAAERHLLRSATKGETHWFSPGHWDLLRKLSPDLAQSLAPAPAGE